jgi:uncharacterized protein YjbI with pentapeptide repeats
MQNQTTTQSQPSWRTEPEIDLERQHFLTTCLSTPPDVTRNVYPFKNVRLTRADIEWLLATHEGGRGPVDWADGEQGERVGLDLRGAHLQGADLRRLPLARVYGGLTIEEWKAATLEQRDGAGVWLEGADLSEAHLEGAILRGAHLEGAILRKAAMQGAVLYKAHLNGAYFRDAHLERANLAAANLEGAYLRSTFLEGTDLRKAFFDSRTSLEGALLSSKRVECARVAEVCWSDVNLSLVDWRQVRMLGDEYKACQRTTYGDVVKDLIKQLEDYREAVRAYRQLANAMRAQGMNEEAVPFAYRAQVLQRKVLWREVLLGRGVSLQAEMPQGRVRQFVQDTWRRVRLFGSYIFSWFLDILAGYGYKPGRSLFIYLLVIAGFAACYDVFGHLSALEALIFSVTSFHGRGFLPGPFALSSLVTALAALEAVMGLFIEISFIATFTQRFFGR